MGGLEVPQFLGVLVVTLAAAKLFGALAQRAGQPAVRGELVAGVVLGTPVLGLVDPKNDALHLLAEIGVVILLFEIGLETGLRKLLQVGGAATTVAVVGVALPFALGYTVCRFLGSTTSRRSSPAPRLRPPALGSPPASSRIWVGSRSRRARSFWGRRSSTT